MKVLIVGSNSTHVRGFIQSLNKVGIVPDYLSEEDCKFENLSEQREISFRSLNPITIIRNVYLLKDILKELNPDIVHIHQLNRLGYFVSRHCYKLGIKCISTAWGSDVLVVPKKNRFYKYLIKKTLLRSEFVTADSQNMISVMTEMSPKQRDKFVYLQYGIELVEELSKEKVIYSNRLHTSLYRIDQIIRYFSEALPSLNGWKLIIAGSGDQTDKLIDLVKELGVQDSVSFVGWLNSEENNKWYGKSHIYISIPSSDGTAVSLLEAMSAGCVPIVPSLEVSKEWIIDGENGVIEKKGINPIEEAMKLDQTYCSSFNRNLVQKNASKTQCTAQFIELYQNATSSK